MYINKCTKCGAEFETKNPKRIICPSCLYPDRKPLLDSGNDGQQNNGEQQPQQQRPYQSSYSYEGNPDEPQRSYPPRNYNSQQGGYNQRNYNQRQGGYQRQRPQGGGYNRNQGGFNRPQRPNNNYRQQGDFQRQGGFNKPNRPNGNRPPRKPMAPRAPKELLVTKEQVAQIEVLYKRMLPLPNPDAHEVIGAEIGLEPRKVFFGINLVRQKLFLPKLPFPKRKLAVSADQLQAIKNLYEPLLPLPPIGCHKILASQLKMDEWRVHVGIGLIRKQMGLGRWNEGREDAPAIIDRPRKGLSMDMPQPKAEKEKTEPNEVVEEIIVNSEETVAEVAEKPKRTTRKKKTEE